MRKVATIILAAGQGTRMNSEKPKVIFELAGKPMINRVVETAKKVDSDLIVVVVGYKKDMVIDTIPASDKIKFVEQIEQNGTGHAVIVTKNEFKEFSGDVFVLCGDVPLLRHQTLERMLQHHRKKNAACTVLTAVMNDALRYGRIVRNKNNSIQCIVEYKDATDQEKQIMEINTGIYCFDAQSLFLALEKVTNNNKQKEYYLTDTLEILNEEKKLVTSVILEDMIEASGVNSQKQLSNLENEFYRRQDHFEN
ncbi:MAG: NTP transferase domain-containing protein [Candidatus Cloacimonetes bacterium]|nr:NTP transferase domain-containing protein [Candidatus Cloacimonadota bacterium]